MRRRAGRAVARVPWRRGGRGCWACLRVGVSQAKAPITPPPLQRKNTFGTVAFCSYGAFWMSLCYFRTLAVAYQLPGPIQGERMMLSLW